MRKTKEGIVFSSSLSFIAILSFHSVKRILLLLLPGESPAPPPNLLVSAFCRRRYFFYSSSNGLLVEWSCCMTGRCE